MKYIYDILLNFNEKLYEFYEWDDCDNFDYVKKIAIIKVNKDTLNDIRNNKIMLDDEFVKEIHNFLQHVRYCLITLCVFQSRERSEMFLHRILSLRSATHVYLIIKVYQL